LRWELSSDASEIEDFVVRVKVADSTVGLEANCKQYPNGEYKPVGLLQRHGESNSMYFGLLSGSYTKNTSGGVLRKKIGSITDEIVANTGQFTAVNGIVKTIDKFRIVDFSYGTTPTTATAAGSPPAPSVKVSAACGAIPWAR
jgi:type IV pilus assembly protein PilY1